MENVKKAENRAEQGGNKCGNLDKERLRVIK